MEERRSARPSWATRERSLSPPPRKTGRTSYPQQGAAGTSGRNVHSSSTGGLTITHWTKTGRILQEPLTSDGRGDVRELHRQAEEWRENLKKKEEEELVIYTDGACYRNGKVDAQASIGVWFGPEHLLNISKVLPVGQRHSNNTAEILAAVEAVKQARLTGHKKVCIRSDSELLVQAWNRSVPFWQNHGWMTAAGKPVKNKREFIMLIEEVAKGAGMVLRMEHVPGHGSCLGNVGADALASAAIRRFVDKKNHERWMMGPNLPPFEYRKSIFGSKSNRGALTPQQQKIVEESCKKVEDAMRMKEEESKTPKEKPSEWREEQRRKAKQLLKMMEQGVGLKNDLRGKLINKQKEDEERRRRDFQQREERMNAKKKLESKTKQKDAQPKPEETFKATKPGKGMPYPGRKTDKKQRD